MSCLCGGAGFLRDLAAMSKAQDAAREAPEVTLEHAARLMDVRAQAAAEALDNEPTNPRAVAPKDDTTDPCVLILRECAVCGQPTPAAWTPPEG